jgi:type I restriction enzyme M protein
LVKVGNLSGKGIDWAARDRNFISPAEREKRRKSNLLIRTGDILLTSSAHSPVYIAKKVDVVTEIPQWVGGEASFVGEVMLIRPNAEQIDPFVLLAFLRHPAVVAQIQRAVRGQTAHLHPRDIGSIKVPNSLLGPAGTYAEIAKLLREEATLSEHSNVLTWRISEKLGSAPVA